MKVLECSSRGDRRFSALYAKVTFDDYSDTIEHHYQGCKRFNGVQGSYGRVKGKKPDYIEVKGRHLEVKYLTPFYNMLWLIYLDSHPDYVEFLKQFDDYNDMFKGKAYNCQADVIRKYIKEGRDSILTDDLFIDFLVKITN